MPCSGPCAAAKLHEAWARRHAESAAPALKWIGSCLPTGLYHPSVAVHRPRLDAVVVAGGITPAGRNQVSHGRLLESLVVEGSGLEDMLATVPAPRKPRPWKGARQARLLQFGVAPGPASVQRSLHSRDASPAGRSQAANLARALRRKPVPFRWVGDYGLGIHHEAE